MEEKKEYDYLIVGAGLFGAVFARRAADAGMRCLVIDRRNHTGGNIYCREQEGIRVHCYGAHIFHTDNAGVWEYVNRFVQFNRFTNAPLAFYKGKLYHLPFNMNTFYALWGVRTPDEAREVIERQRAPYAEIEPANLEEQALKLCGREMYEIFIKGYTEKQWGCPATELPPFIIRRLPFRFTFDNNYFNDAYQGIPSGGYNCLTDGLLSGIEVRLECDYFSDREYWNSLAGKVLFTGCIDAFFGYRFGRLGYRSLRFEHELLEKTDFQGNAVVNYNEREIPHTRIIEHKHFEFGKQPCTVITREYPDAFAAGKEPYYPVNNEENTRIYESYRALAGGQDRVLFGGRLAQYSYFDMDDTVEAALELSRREFGVL